MLKTVVILLVITIVVIIVLFCTGKITFISKSNVNEQTDNIDFQNNENASNTTNIENITTKQISFNEALVDYILSSMEKYADNGNILKDTQGDVTASKLTSIEVRNNRSEYAQKINNLLSNKEIFSNMFIKDEKETITYKYEKLLNEFGYGTHMGVGIGCYDSEGKKIFVYGNTVIDTENPTKTAVIKYFGYDVNNVVNKIIDDIEKLAESGAILKDTQGDVTAPKLTSLEVRNNRSEYSKKITKYLEESGPGRCSINFDNEKLNVSITYESMLNELFGVGSHMGVGLGLDVDKSITEGPNITEWKTFKF